MPGLILRATAWEVQDLLERRFPSAKIDRRAGMGCPLHAGRTILQRPDGCAYCMKDAKALLVEMQKRTQWLAEWRSTAVHLLARIGPLEIKG